LRKNTEYPISNKEYPMMKERNNKQATGNQLSCTALNLLGIKRRESDTLTWKFGRFLLDIGYLTIPHAFLLLGGLRASLFN
jgi:hypothetical protein